MGSLEDQKKMILPFAQRAQEVEKADPKVAYYCRMYALEQGLDIPKDVRAREITAVLGALMDKLEKDKRVVQLGVREEDALHCENFALTVFNRADRVDRAGRADKATAMPFYAASYFFEILRHFGDPAPDTQQKQRYAAWRAAEISRAVKEGRQPEAPPAARQDTDEEAAMLDELAKLETAGASSAPAAASSAPPPPPPQAPSGRLAGLPPPVDDWGAPPPPPPGAADGGDGSGGELRLPSPPKERPIDSQRSGGVWQPPPPRRFQTFQKVLFLPEEGSSGGPVRGTVAKVEEGAHPEHPTYLVALLDRIAAVGDASQLAPELATGETVMYHGPSGHSVEATVAELDLGHWPPSYLVRLADGNYVDTTADRLHQLHVPKPRSEGANLDSLPSGGLPPPPAAAAAGGGGGMYPPPAVGLPPQQPPQQQPPPAAAAPRPAASVPPPVRPAAVAAAAAPPIPQAVPGFQPGLREMSDAAKLAKSATSALQFEDVTTAVKLLTEALRLLTQPK
ncbi:hypothetical protein CHLNCDRAFT_133608 [Chlorella variabilis]|uniref:Vta1/callose synthase N-terminal domain-containing protein n=1 Tax=Chlorella variabilis TaxID=554065 RepID=E1Z3G0_CHLVA|nr:hypothetical protein CHLNCDRAFT_133608 [Chlorella variabilis]EFN60157.1 hypothetical protein CHLNCDRAFT_133608 [Chlorella variabilis]|eukprot:XP_005852259.1 hypothetical protein CHLNCDRAFT_133608 [Chlorella variabilis]